MLLAAACMFFINVVGKNILAPEEYSWLALFLIYIGYLGTLSFLASDSVLIRHSENVNGVLQIPKNVISQMSISWVLGIMFLPLLWGGISENNTDYLLYYLSFLMISISVLLSTINRLAENFVIAQLLLHSWKPIFLILLGANYFYGDILLIDLISQLIIISIAASLLLLFIYMKSNKLISVRVVTSLVSNHELLALQYSFALSFLYFAVLGSVDRILLSSYIGPKEFSDYLYLIALLLFPINVIANYIGFKNLVYYKNNKLPGILNGLYQSTWKAVSLYVFYSLLIFIFDDSLGLKFDFIIWGAVLIVVICKIPYTKFSSIIGARGESRDIQVINHISILVLFFVCVIIVATKDPYIAVYAIGMAWVIRVLLSYRKARLYDN